MNQITAASVQNNNICKFDFVSVEGLRETKNIISCKVSLKNNCIALWLKTTDLKNVKPQTYYKNIQVIVENNTQTILRYKSRL
jgi:hypothetical protein